ncbi:MAG TPA: hypothetical protein VFL41_04765 [Gaiellaceae bacterium]|nr:hypothetical protein [Gaiellaceae bacterium]HET8653305.1 hypothetical protein [Gaiellaceae bacterium]
MAEQTTSVPARQVDGRSDFDFLFGRWRIANRKREDPLAEEPGLWLEFDASSECRPILGGLGNVDLYSAPSFPGRENFHGCGFRLFEPGANVWRIWWASTVGGGLLDTPVVGSFHDGVGRFECDDTIDGHELKVRYDWTGITPSSAHWEQSFSFDGGRTFDPNWIMELTRIA